MEFLIPVYNIDKLEKKVNKIINKIPNTKFNVNRDQPHYIKDEYGHTHKCYKVELEGHYQIEGWEFVGIIEHTEVGNIIRNINDKFIVPVKYRTCKPNCEHCNRIRNRKDTYLVYNKDKNEYKQVGHTCLLDYTGLDADRCVNYLSVLKTIEDLTYFEDYSNLTPDNRYMDSEMFKTYAYDYVKKNGYVKNTYNNILDTIYGNPFVGIERKNIPTGTYENELKEIDEYVNSIPMDTTDQYLYNAKIAWNREYLEHRDLALVASLINTYLKNVERIKREKHNRETTKTVGNIGDKIIIEVDSIRVAYKIEDYHYTSYVYIIVDKEGNTYKYSTNNNLLNAAKIQATIKGFDEYRGVKQTVITRGKVLETQVVEPPKPVEKPQEVEEPVQKDNTVDDDFNWDTFFNLTAEDLNKF